MSRLTAANTPAATASLPPASPRRTPPASVPHTSSPHSASLLSRPASSPLTAGLSCPLTHPLIEQSVLHSLIQQHTRALVPAILSQSIVVCAATERIAVCVADVSDDRAVVGVLCGELCDRLSVGVQQLQQAREEWQKQAPRQQTKPTLRSGRSHLD